MAKLDRFQPLSVAEEQRQQREAREADDGVRIIMDDEDAYAADIDVLQSKIAHLENQAITRFRKHNADLIALKAVYEKKLDSKDAVIAELLEQKRQLRNQLDKRHDTITHG